MCSGIVREPDLKEEFLAVAAQLEALLKDIEWRKPDVEAEEATLARLKRKAKKDPMVDVASQAIVVRVLRGVLNDKIKEANALERRMLDLQNQIEKANLEGSKPGEGEESGEALR